MAKQPTKIYAVLAYSKQLNVTKRIFDEDALIEPYLHTVAEDMANKKAEAFASTLNKQKHQGANDWVAKIKLQDYKPNGLVRGAQIKPPRVGM